MSFVIKIGKFYVIMLLRIFLVFERRKGRDGRGRDGRGGTGGYLGTIPIVQVALFRSKEKEEDLSARKKMFLLLSWIFQKYFSLFVKNPN